jgi:hypothetical protein
MAGQTAAQLGINASTTGGVFKDAAWYSARQYDAASGTFGDPGQIWSKSVAGTGTMVSKEVNQQSSVAAGLAPNANQNYIDAGAPVTGYKDLGSVQTALNKAQNATYQSGNNVTATPVGGGTGSVPGVQTADQIAADLQNSGLLPTTTAPEIPNSAQQYSDLTAQAGIPKLQAQITDLQAQADALDAQTRVNVSAEQGKPVATNVIEGRVTVQKTQAQEQMDFINRQITTKTSELNSALGNIKIIMDLTQTDYTNAESSYNDQFKQAIDTINLIHGIQQDQKTDVQKAQDNARANAQIMVNAITAGNMDISSMPADQQAQLSTLEVQAGLPVGFFSSLRMDAKANIISTSTDNGVTQVLMRNADGSISVQSYGTATGGGTATQKTEYYTNSAVADARNGVKLSDMFKIYAGSLPANDIYTLYNSNSSNGKDTNPNAKRGTGYLSEYGVTLFNQAPTAAGGFQ